MNDIVQSLDAIADELCNVNRTIDFDTETYNLIAGFWEEVEKIATNSGRIATALESIAVSLEKNNG